MGYQRILDDQLSTRSTPNIFVNSSNILDKIKNKSPYLIFIIRSDGIFLIDNKTF